MVLMSSNLHRHRKTWISCVQAQRNITWNPVIHISLACIHSETYHWKLFLKLVTTVRASIGIMATWQLRNILIKEWQAFVSRLLSRVLRRFICISSKVAVLHLFISWWYQWSDRHARFHCFTLSLSDVERWRFSFVTETCYSFHTENWPFLLPAWVSYYLSPRLRGFKPSR